MWECFEAAQSVFGHQTCDDRSRETSSLCGSDVDKHGDQNKKKEIPVMALASDDQAAPLPLTCKNAAPETLRQFQYMGTVHHLEV